MFDGHGEIRGVTAPSRSRVRIRRGLLIGGAVVLGNVIWMLGSDAMVDRLLLARSRPKAWQRAPSVRAIAGCYELTFGDWVMGDNSYLDSCGLDPIQ